MKKVTNLTALQVVLRKMSNWQNSQWLKYAKDRKCLRTAEKYLTFKKSYNEKS